MSMIDLSSLKMPPELVGDLKVAKLRDRPAFYRQIESVPGACPNCGGEGYIWCQFAEAGPYISPPSDHKKSFAWSEGVWWEVKSRFYPCPACRGAAERISNLFENSGLEEEERSWRLDFIDGLEGKDAAIDMGRRFLNSLPNPSGWVAIYGDYGVGKSGVLRVITAACCEKIVSARYVRAEDILRELRTTFSDDSEVTEDQIVQRYGRYQVLAIDEVDRVSDTKWSRSALFTLLDTRYKRRNALATLLATNCDPTLMPAGFEYLQSRMRDGERIEMTGADLRG